MQQLLDSPFVFVLGILVLTVAVPTVAHYWYQLRKAELDASLKHDMLQRGMSAEDIARVLEAPGRRGSSPARATAPLPREATAFRERQD
jgi:hypothetical protein